MTDSAISNFIQSNGYPTFSPKAFFFDMDGVLFNSMPRHAQAWLTTMCSYGIPFTLRDAYLHEGRTGRDIIDYFFRNVLHKNLSIAQKDEIYHQKSALFDAGGLPEPVCGVHDVLLALKAAGIEIFVVTGSGQPSLLDNLENNFPGIFSKNKMVTAFDVTKCKPDPQPYLMALEKSGVKPWEAVVVENAPLGVEAGHAAKLFTIGVNTGILKADDLRNKGADMVLNDMHELLNSIGSLLSFGK